MMELLQTRLDQELMARDLAAALALIRELPSAIARKGEGAAAMWGPDGGDLFEQARLRAPNHSSPPPSTHLSLSVGGILAGASPPLARLNPTLRWPMARACRRADGAQWVSLPTGALQLFSWNFARVMQPCKIHCCI
jgi:hypothetical protein